MDKEDVASANVFLFFDLVAEERFRQNKTTFSKVFFLVDSSKMRRDELVGFLVAYSAADLHILYADVITLTSGPTLEPAKAQ